MIRPGVQRPAVTWIAGLSSETLTTSLLGSVDDLACVGRRLEEPPERVDRRARRLDPAPPDASTAAVLNRATTRRGRP